MGSLHPTCSQCACCCHLKTLLDKFAACPYISIVMSFCSRTKNTVTCSFCWAKVHASDYDPVVETFFIDFNTIRIMSEVTVDDVSVSLLLLLCFFFVCVFLLLFFFVLFFVCLFFVFFVFFIFGSFVPTFVNIFYCSC